MSELGYYEDCELFLDMCNQKAHIFQQMKK